jgi:fluoroquinolone resistance protein
LTSALFNDTILGKVDFWTAYNYSVEPPTSRIRKARFSKSGVSGLLEQYAIAIEE